MFCTIVRRPRAENRADYDEFQLVTPDRAMADHGLIDWSPPYSATALYREDGERATAVVLDPGAAPMEWKVAEVLALARQNPGFLSTATAWPFILPWLQNTALQIQTFWEAFVSPKAMTNRTKALNRVTFLRHQAEWRVIGIARMLASRKGDADGSLDRGLIGTLAEWVMVAVTSDHEAPRRLYKLLKNPPSGQGEDAAQPSQKGKYFLSFVDLVSEQMQLPTKRDLRCKLGVGSNHEAMTEASRAYRALGLQGLPEG